MKSAYLAASNEPAAYVLAPVNQSVRSSMSSHSRCARSEASMGVSRRISSSPRSW